MSMNLYCDGHDLRQTPTWLTYIALYDHTGVKRTSEETKYIYCKWVRSLSDGSYCSVKDAEIVLNSIEEHVKEINNDKDIEFFMG